MAFHSLVLHMVPDQLWPVIVLYVGPETILPLTSALAALIGVLLMMWQRVIKCMRKVWHLLANKCRPTSGLR